MEQRRPGWTELLAAVLSTAAMVWCLIPEHERRLMVMRSLYLARRAAARVAAAQGHAGMGDELGGLAGPARQHYSTAAAVGQLRDALTRRLERLRP